LNYIKRISYLALSFVFCAIAFSCCSFFTKNNPEYYADFVNVIALTEFKDAKFKEEDFESIENSLNSSEDISVKQYFDKISCGNFTVKSVYAFLESNITIDAFKALNNTQQVNFAKEILKNRQTIYKDIYKSEKFTGKLDNKKSGFLDSVVFYIPATVTNTGSDTSSALWPHTMFYTANIGKVNNLNYKEFVVFPYKVQIQSGLESITYDNSVGIMCHELLHVLGNELGINDLYHVDNLTKHPVGIYDIMAHTDYAAPQQLNIYYKSLLGWATLTELNSGEIEIAKTDATGIKFGEKNGEFFIIQYFEESEICKIPCSEGILIYRINTNVKDGNMYIEKGNQVFIFRTNNNPATYDVYNFPAVFESGSVFSGLKYSDGTWANLEINMSFDELKFFVEVVKT